MNGGRIVADGTSSGESECVGMTGGPGSWTGHAMDAFVAQGLSALAKPVLPDLAELCTKSRTWTASFVLRTVFHGLDRDPPRQLVLTALRRANLAIEEYESLRQALADFIHHKHQRPARYYGVLTHGERLVMESRLAGEALGSLGRGSEGGNALHGHAPYKALCALNDAVKHYHEKLKSKNARPGELVPIWLTDTGMRGIGVRDELRFDDIATYVRTLGNVAQRILEPT